CEEICTAPAPVNVAPLLMLNVLLPSSKFNVAPEATFMTPLVPLVVPGVETSKTPLLTLTVPVLEKPDDTFVLLALVLVNVPELLKPPPPNIVPPTESLTVPELFQVPATLSELVPVQFVVPATAKVPLNSSSRPAVPIRFRVAPLGTVVV